MNFQKTPLQDPDHQSRRATVLKFVFKELLKTLHPIAPFVTEELWSHLKDENEQLLIVERYPEYSEEYNFSEDQEMMNNQIELVGSIRNLRSSALTFHRKKK